MTYRTQHLGTDVIYNIVVQQMVARRHLNYAVRLRAVFQNERISFGHHKQTEHVASYMPPSYDVN
jgi:hypothetical protein